MPPSPQSKARLHNERFANVYLVASAATMTVLVVVVVILVFRLSTVSDAEHQSEITACQESNTNRAQDVAIWQDILGGGAAKHPGDSPAKLDELAHDLQLVHKAYAPRNCQVLYSTK
jgi:hypothetical protein